MSEVDRRNFLKGAGLATAAAAAPTQGMAAIARPPKEMPPQAVGMLYDSTLCIGCKACMSACKTANNMPPKFPPICGAGTRIPGTPRTICPATRSTSSRSIATARRSTRTTRSTASPSSSGIACIASTRPASRSARSARCARTRRPASSPTTPTPASAAATASTAARSACRNSTSTIPSRKIAKCQFCSHLQKEGKIPACCDVCPTGASLFGSVKDLDKEIERRQRRAGRARPTRSRAASSATIARPTSAAHSTYVKEVYGDTRRGGTQVRYLAGVPFDKLGLPNVGPQSPRLARRRHAGHALPLADRAGRRLRGVCVPRPSQRADKNRRRRRAEVLKGVDRERRHASAKEAW